MKKNEFSFGVDEGLFSQCPRASICVSTQSKNANRRMLPLKYNTTLEQASQVIIRILEGLPKTKILKAESHYIYAECKTALFSFTEYVEFYFPEEKKEIHFRSVSSGGFTDFGSNKRRLQKIQAQFYQWENKLPSVTV